MTGAASISASTAAGDRATSAGTITAARRRCRAEGCHDATGGVAGGQIGYRWQAGSWVFGVEARATGPIFRAPTSASAFPGVTNRHRDRRIRPVHRSGRLRLEQRPALREGRRRRDRRPVQRLSTGDRCRRSTRRRNPLGRRGRTGLEFGFAPNWSAAVEYNHLFMGTAPITSSRSPDRRGDAHRPHPPGRRHGHRPHQLPLGRPGRREVLIFAT